MKQSLRILHIEDSKEDSELIRQMLLDEGLSCNVTRVETRTGVFDALENNSFDLILADCKLPNFSGLHALEIAHALKPEIPFVFVSGTIGEETAIESLRNGATDYVLKDRLSRLIPAVRRALAEMEERTLCRQLQQRLREAGRLEAISTLSNGIAHDFNNILTIILGHASLLALERNHPERILEISDTIEQAARRGAEVVQQLLAFARKSGGRMSPTELNRWIQEHLDQLKGKLPRQIELIFESAQDLPSILTDTGQLEHILTNLVSNAVDSMPLGGRITLSTKLVPATELPDFLSELATGNYVRLQVADTGAGMDSMTREHVFEPFYTTKERGRGTGMGLPVVYGLMQTHHGCVDVDSEPDKGTTISLFFPVPQPTETKRPTTVHLSDPTLRGSEAILVVEDEMDVSFFLETILQSYGYHVLSAHDYNQALALFEAHHDEIQLAFSDIGLPKVDGITLGLKLRTLKPGLPLILVSGYPSKEFQARIDELAPNAFLSKPYRTHDILQSVRKTLNSAKLLQGA